VCVRMCVCACVRARVCAYTRVCLCVRACVCVLFVLVYVRARMYVYVYTCILVHECKCVRILRAKNTFLNQSMLVASASCYSAGVLPLLTLLVFLAGEAVAFWPPSRDLPFLAQLYWLGTALFR